MKTPPAELPFAQRIGAALTGAPLDLIKARVIPVAIVELGCSRRRVIRHRRGFLERAPILEICGNARRPQAMVAELCRDGGRRCTPDGSLIGARLRQHRGVAHAHSPFRCRPAAGCPSARASAGFLPQTCRWEKLRLEYAEAAGAANRSNLLHASQVGFHWSDHDRCGDTEAIAEAGFKHK